MSLDSCVSEDGVSLFESVCSALSEKNWAIKQDASSNKIGLCAKVGSDVYPVELTCHQDDRNVSGRVIYYPGCSFEVRQRASEFAAIANGNRTEGCLTIDDHGWISYCNTLWLFDAPVTPSLIDKFLLSLLRQASVLTIGVTALRHGEEPDVAACFV